MPNEQARIQWALDVAEDLARQSRIDYELDVQALEADKADYLSTGVIVVIVEECSDACEKS